MKQKKIVIVEDELIIAEEIKTMLLKDNLDVYGIAMSGEECIKFVEEIHPDLVIMDVMLSGKMTGVEAAMIIHRNFGTPVIFLTAYVDEEVLEGAIECDPYGYLVKPVREKDVRTAVKMAFYMIKREESEKTI
ncbi:MAG TPA: response regulator [Candidatus Cloacimonadota bacterium]|nr:response regulator [Candidatus Cloacimonadota bacterium]